MNRSEWAILLALCSLWLFGGYIHSQSYVTYVWSPPGDTGVMTRVLPTGLDVWPSQPVGLSEPEKWGAAVTSFIGIAIIVISFLVQRAEFFYRFRGLVKSTQIMAVLLLCLVLTGCIRASRRYHSVTFGIPLMSLQQ